jgi:pyruvate dehydrogenase E2 component (dihydrolipoamide acetyltransferase)
MTTDLLMPKLGLTMQEGTLSEWKVNPGDSVIKGQVLYVVETEKVATEIEAEADGVFEARMADEGDTIAVGGVVGRLATSGDSLPPVRKAARGDAESVVREPALPLMSTALQKPEATGGQRIISTPLARRIARERGIHLERVTGSGPKGRIKAIDIENAAQAAETPAVSPSASASTRRKPSSTQATMAKRLAEVKQGVPHFYLSTEIEVSALLELRRQLNIQGDLPRLTVTHFVVAALGRALLEFPNINRIWDADFIEERQGSDVAVAVQADGGLFVPVVRNAGRRSLDDLAASMRDVTDRARSGRLTGADYAGASIAVSNAGMHDVTWLTSIINPGHSAILGIGSIREVFRPDANGLPALKREMGCVFSGDHRVHTGVDGLAFLNGFKAILQNPLQLLRTR